MGVYNPNGTPTDDIRFVLQGLLTDTLDPSSEWERPGIRGVDILPQSVRSSRGYQRDREFLGSIVGSFCCDGG